MAHGEVRRGWRRRVQGWSLGGADDQGKTSVWNPDLGWATVGGLGMCRCRGSRLEGGKGRPPCHVRTELSEAGVRTGGAGSRVESKASSHQALVGHGAALAFARCSGSRSQTQASGGLTGPPVRIPDSVAPFEP